MLIELETPAASDSHLDTVQTALQTQMEHLVSEGASVFITVVSLSCFDNSVTNNAVLFSGKFTGTLPSLSAALERTLKNFKSVPRECTLLELTRLLDDFHFRLPEAGINNYPSPNAHNGYLFVGRGRPSIDTSLSASLSLTASFSERIDALLPHSPNVAPPVIYQNDAIQNYQRTEADENLLAHIQNFGGCAYPVASFLLLFVAIDVLCACCFFRPRAFPIVHHS